ncbi:MAG: chorismate mutase [Acholeplasmatales bacterium]|nr:chorismate mutase [Acholeplasmatales bacterium]
MNNLEQARLVINEVDKELVELFKKRMAASKIIALYKKENNIAVLDKKREEALIEKNLKLLNDKELEKYYLIFLEGILNASKDYQKDLINK